MATKSISTIQAKQVLDATHFLLVANNPVIILDIEGETVSNAANYYIQLLNTNTPVSGTTIPLYSRLAILSGGSNGFSFVYRPLGLDTSTMTNPVGGTDSLDGANTYPVYAAISSTDGVYTSVAVATEVTINIDEPFLEIPNQVITGDITTAVDSLQVFASGAGASPKRLVQFQVTNNSGAIAYIMQFADSSLATLGATPLQQWQVGIGATLTQNFGKEMPTMQQSPISYTNFDGCFLYGSSTPQFLTVTTGGQWTIKAWNI